MGQPGMDPRRAVDQITIVLTWIEELKQPVPIR
jgi:hypothetical protein